MLPFLYGAFWQSCERETFQAVFVHVVVLGWPVVSSYNDCIVYRNGEVRLWSQVTTPHARFVDYETPFRSKLKTLS